MTARFLYQNLITAATMLTASSTRPGPVGLGMKTGVGSASIITGGLYTGADPRQYIVEIEGVAGGAEVGQATCRWRRSDDATWRATGILTASTPITLEYNITVQWVTGVGADFVVGDYWTVAVDAPFGLRRLLDRDRDTEWRSADVAAAITIDVDLGSAQAVDYLALCDHNLSAGAVITLAGNSSASWGAPPLLETITRTAANTIHTLTTVARTYRYWRLSLTDMANPDGYLRCSELFLGPALAMSQNFDRGWQRTKRAEVYGTSSTVRRPRGILAQAEGIALHYDLMTQADRDALWALFADVYDEVRGTVRPFLVNLDASDAADVSVYEWDQAEAPVTSPYLSRYAWSLALVQRPRLARSGA